MRRSWLTWDLFETCLWPAWTGWWLDRIFWRWVVDFFFWPGYERFLFDLDCCDSNFSTTTPVHCLTCPTASTANFFFFLHGLVYMVSGLTVAAVHDWTEDLRNSTTAFFFFFSGLSFCIQPALTDYLDRFFFQLKGNCDFSFIFSDGSTPAEPPTRLLRQRFSFTGLITALLASQGT